MIVNRDSLLSYYGIIQPIMTTKKTFTDRYGRKTSYGLTEAGYDIRLAQDIWLHPLRRFRLGSSYEQFNMPNDLMATVLNKSTWARQGIDVSRCTNIEPGWQGYLTLEITYSGFKPILLQRGCGIAQIIFHSLENEAQYKGKYQNQKSGPVKSNFKD